MMPLVSVCLLCYNQRDWIAGAFAAAINQTYSNIELIVVDDQSTDGSSEILQGCIAGYKNNGGKVPIVYCRNEMNLGNLRSTEKAYSLSKGELLVKADGDDYSHVDRVQKIVNAWLANGKKDYVLTSDATSISLDGEVLGYRNNQGKTLGAVGVYRRECYTLFDPVVYPDAHEDVVFFSRALMLGTRCHVCESLVDYRLGGGRSTGSHSYRQTMIRNMRREEDAKRQFLLDVESLSHNINGLGAEHWSAVGKKALSECHNNLLLWDGPSFIVRSQAFRAHHSHQLFTIAFAVQCLLLLPKCISTPLVNTIYAINLFLRRGKKSADWRY